MKKVKRLLAGILIVTLLLSSSEIVFAVENSNFNILKIEENDKDNSDIIETELEGTALSEVQTTGTVGDNGGFQWVYDVETKTLTVTGEDSVLCEAQQQKSLFSAIDLELNKIVFENCEFKGNISYLCKNQYNLKDIKFINCDMSEVTDMSCMFYHCNNLSSIDLSGLDTSNVTDVSYMFYYCSNLGSIDLSNWNTGNVTDMSYMFYYCGNLGSIDLGNWNTGNVTNMSHMFEYCSSLSDIDVGDWDTGNVTDMCFMFSDCNSLSDIDVANWDIENVIYINHMFNYCKSLSSININNWNMRNVKDVYCMFNKCKSLDTIYTPKIISNWDVISLPDTYYDNQMNPITKIESEHSDKILVKNIKQDTYPVEHLLGDIDLGPYALKGATIEILGYEVPLIDLEANIKLGIGDIKIISEDGDTIRALIGFDEKSSANIEPSKNSPTYWSDSYKEVKAMYQDLTGKKVDTTRLWNRFSSLRGKLKKVNGTMVVGVESSLAGYVEFKLDENGYRFTEGGIIASFNTEISLRSYVYAPCYVALGIEVGADGTLSFVEAGQEDADGDGTPNEHDPDFDYEYNKIIPQITIEPQFEISAGVGVGTRKSYAQADAYGTLSTIISTADKDTPFRAGIDLGARIMGYLVGHKLFYEEKSFEQVELYPNFGADWKKSRMMLMPELNVSSKQSYNDLINSAQLIDRDYLVAPFLRSSTYNTASFVKNNAYPLNEVSLVTFDDDNMLLVWIDDTGEKTMENRGTLFYSYYDGTNWSDPDVIHEDGTNNDMPYVYSDGKYAYLAWQKAEIIFEENIDTSEMLKDYDLYVTIFDSQTQSFTNNVCINEGEDNIFEFNHVIYGKDGSFKIAWVENTDNNVFQMSGENTLHISSYDTNSNHLETSVILTTSDMIGDIRLTSSNIYYSLLEENMNLYCYEDTTNTLVAEDIRAFDCVGEQIFYLDSNGLYSIKDEIINTYDVGLVDNFTVIGNDDEIVLFIERLNSDFTKTLLYSKLLLTDQENNWSEFEIYSDHDCYISNFSPVLLNDNTIYTAFNYLKEDVENGTQTSSIVVEQRTKGVDIEVLYADYDDKQLDTGNLDIKIGLKNNSSTPVDSFVISIIDDTGNILDEQIVQKTVGAFEEYEMTFNYTLPNKYDGKIYTIKVIPENLVEFNEANNVAKTTFECLHLISDEWTIDILPTPEMNGIKSQHCEKCDSSFNEVEISYLKFSGASLTLHDNLTINYRVNKDLFEESGYKNPYVKFVFNGKERIVSEYRVVDDKYVFDFDDIAPNQMNDIIYATLYAEYDGVEFASETREYSVATYCYSMLEKYGADEYSKFRTLLVDLLNYGEASQIYTDYNVNHLVTNNLTDNQKVWGTSDTPTFTSVMNNEHEIIDNPTIIWKGAGLNLQDSVTMRFRISAESVEGLSVKINTESKTWVMPDSEFEATEGGYYIYFDKLNAAQMSEPIYLTIYEGETPVSNTVCYSIESYAYSKQNDTDEKLVNLVNAMMKYGNSAYSYIN